MKINLIRFDMKVGRNKPENIIHRENDCPFCHPEGLTDIYETDEGGIILLKNKYDVLENADQLVLVETDRCGIDMPDYTTEHMRRIVRFGVSKWREMEASGKYSAVIFFTCPAAPCATPTCSSSASGAPIRPFSLPKKILRGSRLPKKAARC